MRVGSCATFFSVQGKYFLRYRQYQPLSQLLTNKVYNCLSGTALYALLLERLGIAYTIHETPYHVYLVVHYANGGKALLESTGRGEGFLTGDHIRMRESAYERPDSGQWRAAATLCTPDRPGDCPDSYRVETNLQQLAAMQYHNYAVEDYNGHQLRSAWQNVRKAAILHPASRRVRGLNYYIRAAARMSGITLMPKPILHPSQTYLP